MIVYSKAFLRVAELYFGEEPDGIRADIIRFLQRPEPVEGACCTPFYTLVIDLSRSEEELLAGMDGNTRYEIRRGMGKDGLTAGVRPSAEPETLSEFCDFYDRFAAGKGLAKANRAKLDALRQASSLTLSACRQGEGEPLVWHAYIRAAGRARLLHSASHFRSEAGGGARQLAGRANRFLHWSDMVHFKSEGIPVLDMGGWYEGTADQERLRINAFKQGFGGTVVQTFNAQVSGSLKGALVIRGLGILERLRP